MANVQAGEQDVGAHCDPSQGAANGEELAKSGMEAEIEAMKPVADIDDGIEADKSDTNEAQQATSPHHSEEGVTDNVDEPSRVVVEKDKEEQEPLEEEGTTDNIDGAGEEEQEPLEEEGNTDNIDEPSGAVEEEEKEQRPLEDEGISDKANDVSETEERAEEEQKPLEEERTVDEPVEGGTSDTDVNRSGGQLDTSPTDEIPPEDPSQVNVDVVEDGEGGSDGDDSFATAEDTAGEEEAVESDDGGRSRKPQRRRRGRQDDSDLSEGDTEEEGEGGEKQEREGEDNGE